MPNIVNLFKWGEKNNHLCISFLKFLLDVSDLESWVLEKLQLVTNQEDCGKDEAATLKLIKKQKVMQTVAVWIFFPSTIHIP